MAERYAQRSQRCPQRDGGQRVEIGCHGLNGRVEGPLHFPLHVTMQGSLQGPPPDMMGDPLRDPMLLRDDSADFMASAEIWQSKMAFAHVLYR